MQFQTELAFVRDAGSWAAFTLESRKPSVGRSGALAFTEQRWRNRLTWGKKKETHQHQVTSGYSSVRVTATGTFLCRLRIRCALKRDKSGISLFPKAPVMEHSQLQFGLDWPSEGCCRSSMPSVNFKIQVHTAYNIPLLLFLVYVEHCNKGITAWEV